MSVTAEEFFVGHPEGHAVYRAVAEAVGGLGECEERVSTSQIAFRHGRGFAYVWRPGQYVRSDVPAVLSIALPEPLDSPRIKETVHPSARVWMHHIELRRPADVDAEIVSWLSRAHAAANG